MKVYQELHYQPRNFHPPTLRHENRVVVEFSKKKKRDRFLHQINRVENAFQVLQRVVECIELVVEIH